MYEVTTTYGYHDFLPSYNPNTMMMEVVYVDSVGTYSVFDFSGGLYSEGSYAGAHGIGGENPLVFSDICGNINWTGQTNPWGDILLLAGSVNAVDSATGIITISWFWTGFAESGVSVYVSQ